jgi:hypothetical protein
MLFVGVVAAKNIKNVTQIRESLSDSHGEGCAEISAAVFRECGEAVFLSGLNNSSFINSGDLYRAAI